MRTIIVIVTVALLGACSTPGTTTTPVSANAAQTARDQGAANATESGSATNTVTPIVVNALAAQEVTVTVKDGQPQVTVKANPTAKVTVDGATFGNITFGEGAMSSKVSSGGGAAGGQDAARQTGGDQVRADGAVREPRAPREPRPVTPTTTEPVKPPGGGGN